MLKHLMEQPFIAATGVAALVHSTWSLGTFFSGAQPSSGWALVGWLIPALLIAFSLDVGQIVTSAEIRTHGLTVARGVTFVVFALATYYLQWLYMAHHMPEMSLSAGISEGMRASAIALRDMAIWLIPALMPASTLLYTFSGEQHKPSDAKAKRDDELVEGHRVVLDELVGRDGNDRETRQCAHCGKSFRSRSKTKKYCSTTCRVSASRRKLVDTGVTEEDELHEAETQN